MGSPDRHCRLWTLILDGSPSPVVTLCAWYALCAFARKADPRDQTPRVTAGDCSAPLCAFRCFGLSLLGFSLLGLSLFGLSLRQPLAGLGDDMWHRGLVGRCHDVNARDAGDR